MYKKIVFESLNEIISFERGGNPLSKLGIGKKSLVEKWLKEMNINDYILNDDFIITSIHPIDLSGKDIENFPNYIQFDEIGRYFDCEHCNLTSLKGCPKSVYGYFSCVDNKLTSLEGCPEYVKRDFYCNENPGKFTEKDVRKLCYVHQKINPYNI